VALWRIGQHDQRAPKKNPLPLSKAAKKPRKKIVKENKVKR